MCGDEGPKGILYFSTGTSLSGYVYFFFVLRRHRQEGTRLEFGFQKEGKTDKKAVVAFVCYSIAYFC